MDTLDIKINHTPIYNEIDTKLFSTLKNDYYIETQNGTQITAQNQAIMLNKALQLSNGFVYAEDGTSMRINHYKFDNLVSLLENIKDNVIIFYNFEQDKKLLLTIKGSEEYEGKTTEERWNEGKIKYLILSPFASKYGLNLQKGGHTIVWFGLVWSAEAYVQSNARLYRTGQKHDVNVYYLLSTKSFDDYVYNKLVSKVSTVDDFKTYITP